MLDVLLELLDIWWTDLVSVSALGHRRAWLVLIAVLAALAGMTTLIYFMYVR
ncbi:MAG: hypothetical protein IT434_14230 [Phycisphaerales bacterium]|jgi:hypothetical protein|nr:hypothetical protein [Phycisphaerales bacterium]